MLDSLGKRTFACLLICHQGLGQIINITMVNNTFYPISQTYVYLGFDLWVRMWLTQWVSNVLLTVLMWSWFWRYQLKTKWRTIVWDRCAPGNAMFFFKEKSLLFSWRIQHFERVKVQGVLSTWFMSVVMVLSCWRVESPLETAKLDTRPEDEPEFERSANSG